MEMTFWKFSSLTAKKLREDLDQDELVLKPTGFSENIRLTELQWPVSCKNIVGDSWGNTEANGR